MENLFELYKAYEPQLLILTGIVLVFTFIEKISKFFKWVNSLFKKMMLNRKKKSTRLNTDNKSDGGSDITRGRF